MIEKLRLEKWATPLTIGAFMVQGITGMLMFFGVNIGLARLIHSRVFSLILIVALTFHVIKNWKLLIEYFAKPVGVAIIGILLTLGSLALVVPTPQFPGTGLRETPPGTGFRETPFGSRFGGNSFFAATAALAKSSIKTVAEVAKVKPSSLISKLEAKGISIKSSDQTIGEIAAKNNKREFEILNYVFNNGQRQFGSSFGGRQLGR